MCVRYTCIHFILRIRRLHTVMVQIYIFFVYVVVYPFVCIFPIQTVFRCKVYTFCVHELEKHFNVIKLR